jgi:two-component system, chemotaxis family, sensor kinase CheA
MTLSIKSNQTDLLHDNTRYFAHCFCKALEDMSGVSLCAEESVFTETTFVPKYSFTVMIHFTGPIQGEYAISMQEHIASFLSRQDLRVDYVGFMKEALNVSVGNAITHLRTQFDDLTFLPPVAVFGELDYPMVPSGTTVLAFSEGSVQCSFVLNAMGLELGDHLQAALRKLQETSRESAIARRNMQSMLAAFPSGLAVLDDLGLIMPGYSKATPVTVGLKSGTVLSGMHLLDCLGMLDPKGIRHDEFDQWLSACHSHYGKVDFKDLVGLCPIAEFRSIRDRVIHLDWMPMEDDQGCLESLIVLIEDYTEKRRTEAKASILSRQHEQNAELLSQIVNLEPDEITDFVYDSTWLLEESKRILKDTTLDHQFVDTVYRNIHTLKGNSGQFKFQSLQVLAADIERDIAQARETHDTGPNRIHRILKGIEEADGYIRKLEDLRIKLAAKSETLENKIARSQPSIMVPLQEIRQAAHLLDQLLDAGRQICEHKELITQLEHASSEVSDLILVNVRQYDELLEAAIERIANRMNKSARLEITGKARVDIEVFRKIQQALVHLINNSLDHGIESVRQRLNVGKPACGLVRIAWNEVGALVSIVFSDDGAGIDPEKIRQKIEASGLSPQDWPESDLISWIFTGGFTTKDTVSETSGRGIGLDVVQTNLHELGGTVFVHSTLGKGTSFTLEFPRKPPFSPSRDL